MGSLIFSCPKTRRVIETGIETDDATLARLRSCSLSVDHGQKRELGGVTITRGT